MRERVREGDREREGEKEREREGEREREREGEGGRANHQTWSTEEYFFKICLRF